MALVLVADDNREFAELLRALLEDAGHSVITAYSGLAAIVVVEQHPVECAILDVLIPQISGDAVAERLQQLRPRLPIALMTGNGDLFASTSNLPVLHKPFSKEVLLETVAALLAKA